MKFLLCSDLHLEFGIFDLPKLDNVNEKEITIILAGDIGIAQKPSTYMYFIENLSLRFKRILWVIGNHEHYSGKFPTTYSKLFNETLDCPNVQIVEKETVIIDDVVFICATMWTNMDNCNAITINEAHMWMNDYKTIRTGPETEPWKYKLKPSDTIKDHQQATKFIFSEIAKHKLDKRKIVVVTHHLPSFLSIHPNFKDRSLNGAYASELFEDIMEHSPDIWCHGHTHSSMDYMIGNTRILCNPRGYYPEELNKDFKPNLLVEI